MSEHDMTRMQEAFKRDQKLQQQEAKKLHEPADDTPYGEYAYLEDELGGSGIERF